jgi:hypothetical protein
MHTGTATPTLVVADWAIDPHAVVAACSRHAEPRPRPFALVVPAWLHGLNWAGDPHASEPCAHRQLDRLRDLFQAAGMEIVASAVGDPDPATAIADAVADWSPHHLMVCVRERRLAAHHPLDLVHRAERISGLPVTRIPVRSASAARSCR